ncbi:MAG TPA: hypothetical protein VFC41_01505 [Anaerovoracaceae bacterium]|nr:hypothetical protein [Anaerovoracaceae bacterium]
MEPYEGLAVAIIKQAIKDLNTVNKRIRRCERKMLTADVCQLENEERKLRSLQGNYNMLIRFFTSGWFGTLCDIMGMDGVNVRELIKKSGKIAEDKGLN